MTTIIEPGLKAERIGNAVPNTPEWDAMRADALGGSEIASVVGLSPWVSRFALWHRKAGMIGKQDINHSMEWGTRVEPVIVAKWCEDHPEAKPIPGGTYRSLEHPWKIANPDHLTVDAVLEVKTVDKYASIEWGKPGTAEIPPYYNCQIQWYMDVLGLPRAHMAILIGGNDYRTYEIPYSREDAAWLHTEGEKFWQSIKAGEAPGIDGSTSTYEAIRELHPDIDGSDVALDPMLWDRYLARDDDAKRIAEELSIAKSKVMTAMGNARRGLVLGTPVVRREARGTGRPYLKAIPQQKEATL